MTEPNIDDKIFISLTKFLKKLNWEIAIPAGGGPEDDGNVHGMVIGEKAYVDFVLKHLD